MSLSEFEIKRYEKVIGEFIKKRRPPAHIRNEIDISFRVSGQHIEIFEIRPIWNNPSEKIEHPVAKTTYVKRQKIWKIYWMRADLKWHKYEPLAEVKELSEFVNAVDEDQYACFWG